MRATREALSAGSHDDPASRATGLLEEIKKRKAEAKVAQAEAAAAQTAYAAFPFVASPAAWAFKANPIPKMSVSPTANIIFILIPFL